MAPLAAPAPLRVLPAAEVATSVKDRVAPIRDLVGADAEAAGRLRVNETFLSIQGEGQTTGLPTFFIRTTGCHLRCVWCDTAYAFYEGSDRSLDALLDEAAASGARHVCLTGGEPLLQRPAVPLVAALAERGFHVVVETSGAVALDAFRAFRPEVRERVCLSVDVKCPGSGEEGSFQRSILDVLWRGDQLKFIVAHRRDFDFAARWLDENGPVPCPVFVHPAGGVPGPLLAGLAAWVQETRLPVRLGVQLHKVLWGERRGV